MAVDGWVIRPLGELTENFDFMRVPIKEADRQPGAYPYYGASGIVDYVAGFLFDGEYLLIAEDGENLRTRSTPIAFLASGKFWVNNHAHIVRGTDAASTRFLMYSLTRAEVGAYLTGSTMPKLTQGNMNRIPVLTPPRREQDAIVAILGSLDDKIDLNRRMNETLEAIARALFRSWFVDFDPVRAKLEGRQPAGMDAETAALLPGSFKESSLGPIPSGWSVLTVGEVADIISGGTPSKNEPDFWAGSIPWVSAKDMKSPRLYDAEDHLTEAGAANGTRLVPAGSILMLVRGMTLHNDLPICLAMRKMAFNQDVKAILARAIVGREYLLLWLYANKTPLRGLVDSASHGTGRIHTDILKNVELVVPPPAVLRSFEVKVEAISLRLSVNDEENRTLAALRDALLPKLLSGEIRVRDAEHLIGSGSSP